MLGSCTPSVDLPPLLTLYGVSARPYIVAVSHDEQLHYRVVATVELVFEQSADELSQQLAQSPRSGQVGDVSVDHGIAEIILTVRSRSEVEVFHFAAAVAKDALAGIGRVTALRIVDEQA